MPVSTLRPRASRVAIACSVAGLLATVPATAAPPEPSGAHPRLWLDAKTKASVKALAGKPGSAVDRAIQECRRATGALTEEARNAYMGFNWASNTTNCAIAWHATGDAAHARTGIHFFKALLDDWGTVGDGKGGDTAVRHDSGYAIRAVGVHAGIGYDLLHDAPGMTPELLAKARSRFAAWSDWYLASGYRAKSPGNNYQAGYLFAVTAMAIAQGSEGGTASAKLWRFVADDLWTNQMRRAAQPGGVLDGGDWGEGWQYGPLSVASYALASRAMIEHGVPLPEMATWADAVVMRHIHALGPGEKGIFVAGDTQEQTPSIKPNAWTLAGAIAGPSSEKAAAWARAEMDRLRLKSEDKSFLIYDVLAEARGVPAAPFPRNAAPTMYMAKGTGALYARSSWSPNAVWMAVQCTKTIDVDHLPANAGNFVLSRGPDELIVDPSPYGTLSSLTSNAPTVESAQLPADYKPSQAFWSEKTRYVWARQTESAVVAARCDYADQYKFQERPSDVPQAVRDLVLVPATDASATLVVIDRASSGVDARGLHLRFRTPLQLGGGKDNAVEGTNGRSTLAITPVHTTAVAKPAERKSTSPGDCFGNDTKRGNCNAARFPVNDYAVTLKGKNALAVHVIDVAPSKDKLAPPQSWGAADHRVVAFERGGSRAAVVIAEPGAAAAATLMYRADPGRHVVLDGPGSSGAGRATATAERDGAQCRVTVRAVREGGMDARPLAVVLSPTCEVKEDPLLAKPALLATTGEPTGATGTSASTSTATGEPGRAKTGEEVFVPPPVDAPRPRSGACACAAAGCAPRGSFGALGSLAAAAGVLLLGARVRRRRQRSTTTS